MFALVILTAIIGLCAFMVRYNSVKKGEVKIKFYRTMQGSEVSERIIQTTRCFNNMFEVPVLFYIVSTLYVALGVENTVALILAWLFVILRYIHAYIFMTYNNVIHRMLVFWGSFLSLFILWIVLIVRM